MVKTTYFIEPVDVLHFRGNRLFGDPGSFSDAVMPPWPSTFAGAIRSEMLVRDGINLECFAKGQQPHPLLGTPSEPGEFRLLECGLARRLGDSVIERYYPLPADLVMSASDAGPTMQRITPKAIDERIQLSAKTSKLPVLAESLRSKPVSGWFLRESGWQKYLQGQLPCAEADIIHQEHLWSLDLRVGVGLDTRQRTAADGQLFTNQVVCLKPSVGFYVTTSHAGLPNSGVIRLGGDGRAAHYDKVETSDLGITPADAKLGSRCRFVLTTPGIFTGGWLPNGVTHAEDQTLTLHIDDISASVVAACVSKPQVVSGWDIATKSPKVAVKCAPAGSVFWLENLNAGERGLGKLAELGLWPKGSEDNQRRAEGFNQLAIGVF